MFNIFLLFFVYLASASDHALPFDLSPYAPSAESLVPSGTTINPYHTHSSLQAAVTKECEKQNIQPGDLFLISVNGKKDDQGVCVRDVYVTPAVENAITTHTMENAIQSKKQSEQEGLQVYLTGAMRGAGIGFSAHPEALEQMRPEHLKTMECSSSNGCKGNISIEKEKAAIQKGKPVKFSTFDDVIDTAASTAVLLLNKHFHLLKANPSLVPGCSFEMHTNYIKTGHPSTSFDAFWDPKMHKAPKDGSLQPHYEHIESTNVRTFLHLVTRLLKHKKYEHSLDVTGEDLDEAIITASHIIHRTSFTTTISANAFEELTGSSSPWIVFSFFPQSFFHSCPDYQQLSNALRSGFSAEEIAAMEVVFPFNADQDPQTLKPTTSVESMQISLGFSNALSDVYLIPHQTAAINAVTGERLYTSISPVKPTVAVIVGNKDASEYNRKFSKMMSALTQQYAKVAVFNKGNFSTEDKLFGNLPFVDENPDIKIHKFQTSETATSYKFDGFGKEERRTLYEFFPSRFGTLRALIKVGKPSTQSEQAVL